MCLCQCAWAHVCAYSHNRRQSFFQYGGGMKKDAERTAIIERLIASLKRCREEKELSLNETAWRSGLSHTMILRMERGERLPTIETLLRIADALETDLPTLLREATQSVRFPRPTPQKSKSRRKSPP